jgi:nucleoid DNA-binding protein
MKKHVVDELKSFGIAGSEAEQQFERVSEAMANLVKRGVRVRIPGIGTLVRKSRAETRRRNPRTGEGMTIGAYDVVSLRNPAKF